MLRYAFPLTAALALCVLFMRASKWWMMPIFAYGVLMHPTHQHEELIA